MMGVPGSYDASVYDHFEDTDKEGLWFVKRYLGQVTRRPFAKLNTIFVKRIVMWP